MVTSYRKERSSFSADYGAYGEGRTSSWGDTTYPYINVGVSLPQEQPNFETKEEVVQSAEGPPKPSEGYGERHPTYEGPHYGPSDAFYKNQGMGGSHLNAMQWQSDQQYPRVMPGKEGPYRPEPTELFSRSPMKVGSAFSDPSMRQHAPTLIAMAMNDYKVDEVMADYSLSKHSSRMSQEAKKRGFPVIGSPDNPDMMRRNDIDESGHERRVVSHIPEAYEGGRHEDVAEKVPEARQRVREMFRGSREAKIGPMHGPAVPSEQDDPRSLSQQEWGRKHIMPMRGQGQFQL